MKVMLDIDGVIGNFYAGFAGHLNKTLNAGLDLSIEHQHYSIHNWGHNLPKNQVEEEISNWVLDGGYLDLPIYPNAKEFVFQLMDKYDVYIVTARVGDFKIKLSNNIVEKIKEDTYGWLKKYGIPTNKLFFEHKKTNFCLQNKISVLVEDKLDNAINGTYNGLTSILINRGWNKASITSNFIPIERIVHPRFIVAQDYNDILNILEKL